MKIRININIFLQLSGGTTKQTFEICVGWTSRFMNVSLIIMYSIDKYYSCFCKWMTSILMRISIILLDMLMLSTFEVNKPLVLQVFSVKKTTCHEKLVTVKREENWIIPRNAARGKQDLSPETFSEGDFQENQFDIIVFVWTGWKH